MPVCWAQLLAGYITAGYSLNNYALLGRNWPYSIGPLVHHSLRHADYFGKGGLGRIF